mmetsp:Transcript_156177/g.501039  ORF Transcript_156177/g.501039 Transcript_156177/m.501039 type:complete len:211 (+) Transcript_156177:1658-2290(+)
MASMVPGSRKSRSAQELRQASGRSTCCACRCCRSSTSLLLQRCSTSPARCGGAGGPCSRRKAWLRNEVRMCRVCAEVGLGAVANSCPGVLSCLGPAVRAEVLADVAAHTDGAADHSSDDGPRHGEHHTSERAGNLRTHHGTTAPGVSHCDHVGVQQQRGLGFGWHTTTLVRQVGRLFLLPAHATRAADAPRGRAQQAPRGRAQANAGHRA